MDDKELILKLGKVLATQELILQKLEEGAKQREKLEDRIAVIENKVNMAAGAIVIFTAAITLIVEFVVSRFKGLA